MTVQATVKSEQDTWKGNLEWAYLSFAAAQGLTLRAGRLRLPIYMYSETLDVGFTHPWLRLPDETRRIQWPSQPMGALLIDRMSFATNCASIGQ